ncbi:MAG: hypothetical protein AAF497_11160 [Planctomycetota bacterium]
MTVELESAIRAQIAALQRRLGRLKDSSLDLTTLSPHDLVDITALLPELEHELFNPLYAIIGNSEIIGALSEASEQRDLAQSTKRAARCLERHLRRLVEVSLASLGHLELLLAPTSMRSVTHQALLLASETTLDDQSFEYIPAFHSADRIVETDGDRLAQLLASCILSVVGPLPGGRVKLTYEVQGQDSHPCINWFLSIDSNVPPDWRRAVAVPSDLIGNSGMAKLDVLYSMALADALDARVIIGDVPPCLRVLLRPTLLHIVREPEESPQLDDDVSIFAFGDPNHRFSELPHAITELAADQDIVSALEESRRGVLVLHQHDRAGASQFSKNMEICSRVRIPILLRATSLTREQYSRYRDNLDAIVMEPCRPDDLLRFIAGLTRSERRSRARRANIY